MKKIKHICFAFLCTVFSLQGQTTFLYYDLNGNQVSKITEGTLPVEAIQGPETACVGDSLTLIASGGVSVVWGNGSTGDTIVIVPETSTTYNATVTFEDSCKGKYFHFVEVLPKPEPVEINGDLIGIPGEVPNSYSIEPVSQNSTYLWSVEGGYILSGYGTSEIEISWFADSIGLVQVVEQNEAGCFGDTVSQEVIIIPRQVIPLKAGWNLISTYLDLLDITPEGAFADLQDNLIKVKNIEQVYDPNVPPVFNTLEEILPAEGYWVKIEEDEDLILRGHRVDPLNTPIVLKAGWNLIGYTWDEEQSVESAFEEIEPYLEKVKDIYGSYDPNIPPVFNTLDLIEPGKGYWVKVTQAISFVFPPPGRSHFAYGIYDKTSFSDLAYNYNFNSKVVAYPNSTIAYGIVTRNGKAIKEGTYIGVFCNDECRALGEVKNQSDTSFVSFVINGEVEEEVEFRMIYDGELLVSDFKTICYPGNPFPFLLPISFDGSPYFSNSGVEVFVFPNPFSDRIDIEIKLENPRWLNASIVEINGSIVKLLNEDYLPRGVNSFSWQPSIQNLPSGIYFLRIQGKDTNIVKEITYQK